MSSEANGISSALDQVEKIVEAWNTATPPNAPIEGLDYEILKTHIESVPSKLKSAQNNDLINIAHNLIESLPRMQLQDQIADREAIVINSRILDLKNAINDVARIARRNGYFDPDSQILNVSGPEADELRKTLLEELSGVKSAIGEIKVELAKKNLDPGISISFLGVSINLSKALTFIDDQTEDTRRSLVDSAQINITALRRKLKGIADESKSISGSIKDKIKIFGSKVAAAAKRLDLLAHQALSSGLKLVKNVLEAKKPDVTVPDSYSTAKSSSAAVYVASRTAGFLADSGFSVQNLIGVRDVHLRQRTAENPTRNSGYWLVMRGVFRNESIGNFSNEKKEISIEFYLEPKIVTVLAAYNSELLISFVEKALIK